MTSKNSEFGKTVAEQLDFTRRVFAGCCLENGAIVAARPDLPEYPPQAKNYFFVWPRDAAYVVLAGLELGQDDIAEGFFNWLRLGCRDWQKEGLLREKYHPNGAMAGRQFQPDQTGTVLLAWGEWHKRRRASAARYSHEAARMAGGLAAAWRGWGFDRVATDLWEERHAFPDLKECFCYSAAVCARGLAVAAECLGEPAWKAQSDKMRRTLVRWAGPLGYFPRSHGALPDLRIDACAMGVLWPAQIVPPGHRLARGTLEHIRRTLAVGGGVHRYAGDEYDGWMYHSLHRKKGSGSWPLLNFWLSIALAREGRKAAARRAFRYPLVRCRGYLPEQIFDNALQQSITPLAWSHAMFVLAARRLGRLGTGTFPAGPPPKKKARVHPLKPAGSAGLVGGSRAPHRRRS